MILKIAPKVCVLKRKCAISLKNSKECFLGCKGYVSASQAPKIVISFTLHFCSLLFLFPVVGLVLDPNPNS